MKSNILIIAALAWWLDGHACKCSGPGTVEEAYRSTAVIIYGKVISKEVVSFAASMKIRKANEIREQLKSDSQKLQAFESNFIVEIKLQVIDSYKHKVRDTVTIYTTINGASCGYKFEMEKKYIVYASRKSYAYSPFLSASERKDVEKENTYWTNHCTRTAEYRETEVQELRRLKND